MQVFHQSSFINGCWVTGPTLIDVNNPSTGEIIGSVPNFGAHETEAAIQSADAAQKIWRSRSGFERAVLLRNVARLIEANLEPLAQLLTTEQGKPLREARAEILYGKSYFEWFAGEAERIQGDVLQSPTPGKKILVLKEPLGICAAITPWNFPHAMLARKLAAALAAGCSLIAKPAPETPFSALALAALLHEAESPAGLFNVVTGDAEPIAQTLMKSNLVRKISFTGSTEVGKILIRQSADTVKRLTLELGGNAPFIVCADADLNRTVDQALIAKFRNAGQTCICVNRFIVERSVAAEFSKRLSDALHQLRVGDGHSADTDIGPLISHDAVEKVRRLVLHAQDNGATLSAPFTAIDRFVHPLLIGGVTRSMQIWNEEIFGPVATISEFDSETEALSLANDTVFGLAAYLFTSDISRGLRLAEQIESGMVGINDTAISAVNAPFGGVKHSGYGREGSTYGIEEYTSLKYISLAE